MTLDPLLQQAIQHHQAGRLAQAEPLYRQVLAQRPNHPTALHLLGVIAGQVGRLDVAESLIRQAIAIHPNEPFYYLNLGKFLADAGQHDAAIAALREAVRLNPSFADAHSHLGAALRARGFFQEAVAAQREALRLQPQSPDIQLNLGNALHSAGHVDEAIALFENLLRQHPTFVGALNNLGAALKLRGRTAEAIPLFQRAVQLQPTLAEAHDNLGTALHDQCRLPEAIAAYRRALEINPRFPEALNNLGSALNDSRQFDEAVACFRQALALRPDFPEAFNNLGIVSLTLGRVDDALDAFQQALRLRPTYVDAHCNIGNAFTDVAQLHHAEASFRRALELEPSAADAHSNLLFTLHFDPAISPADILAEARRWNEHHAAPHAAKILPHTNDPSPDRPLRLGFVSPDFREHCQALFTFPLFSALDRAQFHITAYSDFPLSDPTTDTLRSHTDAWRPIAGLPDDDLASLIRADQVDILFDLTMHMAHNRLRVFARKPAPIQISWLAYPGTTGVAAIDYRFSDPYLDPENADLSRYSEKTLRLPDSFWCYNPLTTGLPVNDLPALAHGHITFGSLNNFCKVNDAVLDLWARTMKAAPNSRLLLLTPEGRHRAAILQQFAAHGISPDRLELLGRRPRPDYLRHYHRIDLGLDTFPYNGHTTSLDAMWMGVPVVTLVGNTVVGRAGLSQLTNIALTDLIAHTPEDFLRIATSLAADLPRLQSLRQSLRPRMEASPLMDAARFASHFGAACRALWTAWCRQRKAGL